MKYLTVTECAHLTGFRRRAMASWIEQGKIKSIRGPTKAKARYFITPESLLAFAKKMKLPVKVIVNIEKLK